ncbi:collagen binding domain-containing protein [[Muricauda] lutisoli]|uniref:Uncharacterized protein n=1 Tax=[Muricauda] lutisoli TaxID=2816035 RepID=A0ABS3EUB3_9FLAO|nr:hypothetical protein [[Muricauda] lutisoli]MBO0329738.1 hypothetical protein [[Muricauda] lutisoli]
MLPFQPLTNSPKIWWQTIRNTFYAVIAIIILNGCGGDSGEEPPKPEPTPTPTSLVVNINAQQPGVRYDAWKNGESLDSDTSGSDGDAQLVISPDLLSVTGKGSSNPTGKTVGTLDSITGTKSGKQTYIQTNVSLSDSQEVSVDVNDYGHTINVDCNSGNTTYHGYKNGENIVNGTVDYDGFGEATFFNFEQQTTLDSLVFKPNYLDFLNQTFFNQTIGESKDYLVTFVRESATQAAVEFTPTHDDAVETGFEVTINGQSYQTEGLQLIIEGLEPGTKNVTIEDLGADGNASTQGDSEFLPYETTLEFVAGNNSFSPDLEDVPNVDTIEFTIRNNDTQSIDTNATVEVYDSNNNLLGSGSPDANGVFKVDNVPSGTEFYVKTSGSGKYTTTFHDRNTPSSNETIDDMTEQYGAMTFSPGQLKDGSQMQASQIDAIMPKINWPITLLTTGHQRVYLPDDGNINRGDIIVFYAEMYAALGRTVEILTTPLANPNANGVQPYQDLPNYSFNTNEYGVNVESYTGGGTNYILAPLPNNVYGIAGVESNLDNANFAGTGHEALLQVGVRPSSAAEVGGATATHTNKALNIDPRESNVDFPITKYFLDAGEYRIKPDANGDMWLYSFPRSFE